MINQKIYLYNKQTRWQTIWLHSHLTAQYLHCNNWEEGEEIGNKLSSQLSEEELTSLWRRQPRRKENSVRVWVCQWLNTEGKNWLSEWIWVHARVKIYTSRENRELHMSPEESRGHSRWIRNSTIRSRLHICEHWWEIRQSLIFLIFRLSIEIILLFFCKGRIRGLMWLLTSTILSCWRETKRARQHLGYYCEVSDQCLEGRPLLV